MRDVDLMPEFAINGRQLWFYYINSKEYQLNLDLSKNAKTLYIFI